MGSNPNCHLGLNECDCKVAPQVTVEHAPQVPLLVTFLQLRPRERRVLERIASRLLDGQKAYGPLSPGKKNWKKEAKEEAMDMSVYLSVMLEDDEGE